MRLPRVTNKRGRSVQQPTMAQVDHAKLLLGHDIDKRIADTGATPLFTALQSGHLDFTRLLIKSPAFVDKQQPTMGRRSSRIRYAITSSAPHLIESHADKATTDTNSSPLCVMFLLVVVTSSGRLLLKDEANVDNAMT